MTEKPHPFLLTAPLFSGDSNAMLFPTHSAQQGPLVVPGAASVTHLGYSPRTQECCVVGMAWPPSGLPRRPGQPLVVCPKSS